jgi:hypothetical protein
MEKDFTVDKVEWHTKKIRNYDFDNSLIYQYFISIIEYLQKNNLTTKIIATDGQEINDNTSIKKSDLTEEGLELVKKCYSKWIDKVVNQKILSTDYRMLDKALNKLRSQYQKKKE